MARRTGIPTIIMVLHEVCRLLVKFRAKMDDVHGQDQTRADAIDNVLEACVALTEILAPLLEQGD